jgi:broad specificity phosphatase PhoE
LGIWYDCCMKITAVRHGETEGNVRRITQSHAPGKLTTKGLEQAKKLALLLEDERLDVAYSSDLKRASDTALIILEKHVNIELVYTPLLRERSLGLLDGRSYESVPSELYDPSDMDLHAPEGESWRDVKKRLVGLLNEMYVKHPRAHVLIVSHGWTLKVLRSLLTDLPLQESLADHIDNATAQIWLMSGILDTMASQSTSTDAAPLR